MRPVPVSSLDSQPRANCGRGNGASFFSLSWTTGTRIKSALDWKVTLNIDASVNEEWSSKNVHGFFYWHESG